MTENQSKAPVENYYKNDEISITDLVITLISRKWLFIGLFMIFFSGSTIFGFLLRPSSQTIQGKFVYTSYLSVGYSAPTILIEPFESISLIISDVYALENSLKYNISIENTANILKIKTISDQEDGNAIAGYHKSLLLPIVERHKEAYKLFRSESDANNKSLSVYLSPPTSILSLAQKEEYRAPSPKVSVKLILIGGIIFGMIAAVFGVFFIEFLLQLNKELKQKK